MDGDVVREVAATMTHDLRRRVLREGVVDPVLTWEGDDDEATLHLAALDDGGTPVAVATLFPAGTALRRGATTWRLRGMAVDPSAQGTGVGRALLDAAVARLRAAGAEAVWADGRDTALGFYERNGWHVEGEGYTVPVGDEAMPHHTVVLDL